MNTCSNMPRGMDKWQILRDDMIATIDKILEAAQKISDSDIDGGLEGDETPAEEGVWALAYTAKYAPEDRDDLLVALSEAITNWIS